MGTRLRNFSTNPVTKVIAFILVIISITTVVLQLQYLYFRNINPECLFVKEYKDSDEFLNSYVYNAFRTTLELHSGSSRVQNEIPFLYYITDGEKASSNTQNTGRSFFEQYDRAFFAFEKGNWSVGKNTNSKPFYNAYNNYNYSSRLTAYIAFPDELLKEKQQVWEENKTKLVPYALTIFGLLALLMALIVLLIFSTGREAQDKELHMAKLDRIYTDIMFVFLIPLAALWVAAVSSSPGYGRRYQAVRLSIDQIYSMILVAVTTILISALFGMLILSLVRKIKAGKLLRHSLIYTVFYKIFDFFKSLFDGRMFEKYPLTKSLFYRQLVFITSSAILVFFTLVFAFAAPPLALFLPLLEAAIIYWYIKGNNKTFDDINKGFNDSLEEQMKSERMKIALVTNVSHDLKTPLTSIISYVDLLSKEQDLSETVTDYVKILADKSNRLKHIVSDLFDLAKSTSGNMPVDFESIDLKKLIEQTLADMEGEIERSGLQIKINLPDKPVNIYSDGKKLYRVFQNVIDNSLKYSLKGTRVYIELEENDGRAIARIKNTAGYEMDFTVDEILQRFNRGDRSRTTDGSGLGLSIAESFTNLSGGNFKVDIDGDLFKVTIGFDLYK